MQGGHQEDTAEFLGFFEKELLTLVPASASKPTPTVEAEEGWLEVGRKNHAVVMRTITAAESPISRIFRGKFCSTLRAAGQKDSVIIEDWRALRLDIRAVRWAWQPRASISSSRRCCPYSCCTSSASTTTPRGSSSSRSTWRSAWSWRLGVMLAPPVTMRKPVRYKLFVAVYHHGASAAYRSMCFTGRTGGHGRQRALAHVGRAGWCARSLRGSVRAGARAGGGRWAGCWAQRGCVCEGFYRGEGG
ncbi:hypothetical protein B0H17DRAFT_2309 [Mycena rosella]|uniref:Uncharacterized protein n=1 Tax=Mycena rosella TaxID=1033263 RepID=A0AAD7H224_MYCRO|nr:hypothetical protein B0H17DRAFT_2309 [Mycena rosella]